MTGPSARSPIPERKLDAETRGVFITLALAVRISEKEAAGVEMPANMPTESLNAGFILRVIAHSPAKTAVIAGGASASLRTRPNNCASCLERPRLRLRLRLIRPISVTEILFQ